MKAHIAPFRSLVLALLGLVRCTSASPPDDDVVPVDGDPNGLWWNDATGELLIADDDGNRILGWHDGVMRVAADLPPTTDDGPGLGQLVGLDDGTLVVTRFGFGVAGDVVVVSPSGDAKVVDGLDPERRRIGLTVAEDGSLYTAWFVKVGEEQLGAVGRLDLDTGRETTIVEGLGKAIGVLALGDALYVSVQNEDALLRIDPENGSTDSFAQGIEAPDLLSEGPDGSLFVGSGSGVVYQVAADGTFTSVASGMQQVRGVAWDGARLFVVDHDADTSDGASHAVRIFALGAA